MKRTVLILGLVFSFARLQSQDLLSELETLDTARIPVVQTFKGVRIINGHSVETRPSGNLEFIISHRFGRLNSGGYNLYGLDEAFIRLGLEYGITKSLNVGIGRSSGDKSIDGFLKSRITRQVNQKVPVSIAILGGITYFPNVPGRDLALSGVDRSAFHSSILIARKFRKSISFQLTPGIVHRNAVHQAREVNTLFVLAAGGAIKITKSLAINAEYYWRANEKESNDNHDSIGIGIDMETGGHVFQLIFTNSVGMNERAFISESTGNFFKGDIHFGFNITRSFQLKRKG